MEWSDKVTLKLRRRATFKWEKPPKRALLVRKPGDEIVANKAAEVAKWLQQRGIKIFVEPRHRQAGCWSESCTPYFAGDPDCDVDFGVILGGDGTLLHYAKLFSDSYSNRSSGGDSTVHQKRSVPLPPCVSFGMGSLGFMTGFSVDDYERVLSKVTDARGDQTICCTLRTRLDCRIKRLGETAEETEGKETIHQCLNECVIDKGIHPGLGKMALIVDGMPVTVVQGDGLIISTPSGSTGYNLAVGGAIAAPSVPCNLVTPIAPSSLSFRPVILPESSKIEVAIPHTARTDGRAIFDGQCTEELRRGDSIVVETSIFPIPVINERRYDQDWFSSIVEKLQWNSIVEQKPL